MAVCTGIQLRHRSEAGVFRLPVWEGGKAAVANRLVPGLVGLVRRPETAARHAAEIRKLHRTGINKSEIARRLQVGRTSVRRILTSKRA